MAAGDEQAFVQLYRKHQRSIYRFALLMSGSANIAEEVTQEVFLTLIREPGRYDPARGPVLAFLYGVARNHVLHSLKKEKNYVPLSAELTERNAFGESVAPEDPFGDYTRNEMIQLVRRAVLTLPPRYREVVVLCDFQEVSCAEAALVLDCAVGTVNSRLHRGHTLLLKKLRAAAKLDPTSTPAQGMRCFA